MVTTGNLREGNTEVLIRVMEKRHLVGDLKENEWLGQGANNVVERVCFAVQGAGGRMRNIILAKRRCKNRSRASRTYEAHKEDVQMHECLRQKGVRHIIPTYRFDERTGEIFMTDLTSGGKVHVLSNDSVGEKLLWDKNTVALFPQDILNKEELLEQAWDICFHAARTDQETGPGYLLHSTHALFILVRPETQTASIIVGDYKHVWSGSDCSGTGLINGTEYPRRIVHPNVVTAKDAILQRQKILGITREEADRFFRAKLDGLPDVQG